MKSAFRPKAGGDTYEKRSKERMALAATKAKEKEMKEEKEAERQVCTRHSMSTALSCTYRKRATADLN